MYLQLPAAPIYLPHPETHCCALKHIAADYQAAMQLYADQFVMTEAVAPCYACQVRPLQTAASNCIHSHVVLYSGF
jgi:hypothetical protein